MPIAGRLPLLLACVRVFLAANLTVGEGLPLTHFLRIVRGIMPRGNGWAETWPNVWPLRVFMVVVMAIGFKRYRKTLD